MSTSGAILPVSHCLEKWWRGSGGCESAPGGGTEVSVSLPLPENADIAELEVFLVAGQSMMPVNEALVTAKPEVWLHYDSAGSQRYEVILEIMFAAGDPPEMIA